MICITCGQTRKTEDFFGNKCFKCVFREKLKDIKKPENKCKYCGEIIPEYRSKYCSKECLNEVTKEKKKCYWTKNIKIVSLSWHYQ